MLSNLHCKFNVSNLLWDADTERLERGSKQELGPIVHCSTQTHGKKDSGCKYRVSKCQLEFFTVISLYLIGTQHYTVFQDIALHFCFESSACPDLCFPSDYCVSVSIVTVNSENGK